MLFDQIIKSRSIGEILIRIRLHTKAIKEGKYFIKHIVSNLISHN